MKSYVEGNAAIDDPIRFVLNQRMLNYKGKRVGTCVKPIEDVKGFNTAFTALRMKKLDLGNSVFKLSVWPHRKELE